MYSFTDPRFSATRGAEAPVTCATCGCRLTQGPGADRAWRHFHPFAGHDARGCRVDCVDLPHDSDGHPLRPS